jgi:peptidoglycan/LPS O-acetylase OafA/YrhL
MLVIGACAVLSTIASIATFILAIPLIPPNTRVSIPLAAFFALGGASAALGRRWRRRAIAAWLASVVLMTLAAVSAVMLRDDPPLGRIVVVCLAGASFGVVVLLIDLEDGSRKKLEKRR